MIGNASDHDASSANECGTRQEVSCAQRMTRQASITTGSPMKNAKLARGGPRMAAQLRLNFRREDIRKETAFRRWTAWLRVVVH
jgi:hypothetical protein